MIVQTLCAVGLLLAAAATVPIAVLFAQCILALLPTRSRPRPHRTGTVTVLIPAHDEAASIASTIRSIQPELRAADRVLVVADNCTDATAKIAASTGATVIERRDGDRRGKGYALAHGLSTLDADPPKTVLFLDADTQVRSGSIDVLCAWSERLGRPVQPINLLRPPSSGGVRSQLSSFAFGLRNWVRPRGLDRVGLPCHLTGACMAVPWSVVDRRSLESGNIVEDMQFGIDLALAGHLPAFCEDGLVTGVLPSAAGAARNQRTRWEHGHLRTLISQGPRLLWAGLRQRRVGLVSMALDLAVPPLALLSLWWLLGAAVCGLAYGAGADRRVVWVSGLSGGLLVLTVGLSWLRFFRREIPLGALAAIPVYLLWKLPVYLSFLFRPERRWRRTSRE